MAVSWYRSRSVQAAVVLGLFTLGAGIITSPHWSPLFRKGTPDSVRSSKAPHAMPLVSIESMPSHREPCSLQVWRNATGERLVKVLSEINDRNSCRELEPLESGKSVSETASGTFFFADAGELAASLASGEARREATTLRVCVESSRQFRLLKTSEDIVLVVAFVSQEQVACVSRLDGRSQKQITALPRPWGTVNTLVLLPANRACAAKLRTVQTDEANALAVLDITLF